LSEIYRYLLHILILYAANLSRCLKPGGYIELCELSNELHTKEGIIAENNGYKEYLMLVGEAFKIIGCPYPTAKDLKGYLEDSGFENIQETSIRQFCRHKVQEQENILCCKDTLEAYGIAPLIRGLGKTEQDARKIIDAAWEAITANKRNHMYTNMCVFHP
jgi:hypothetical protein